MITEESVWNMYVELNERSTLKTTDVKNAVIEDECKTDNICTQLNFTNTIAPSKRQTFFSPTCTDKVKCLKIQQQFFDTTHNSYG